MTGTAAGDPIEAEALAQTFGRCRNVDDPIFVGSVKTNVGHAEPVSGLAAVIKTCFTLQQGLIPRNLNYMYPHKNIPLVCMPNQVSLKSRVLFITNTLFISYLINDIFIEKLAFASANGVDAMAG